VVHYRESIQPVKRFSACFWYFAFEWLKNRLIAIKTNNFCNLFRIFCKNLYIHALVLTQKHSSFLNDWEIMLFSTHIHSRVFTFQLLICCFRYLCGFYRQLNSNYILK